MIAITITVATRKAIRRDRRDKFTIDQLCRKYRVAKSVIYEAIKGIPYQPKEQLRLIASRLNSSKGYTDEEIAEFAVCSAELVKERRALHNDSTRRIRTRPQSQGDDALDSGARISATWLRQHCSRGQRTIYQIQAVWGSLRYSLQDVIASVQAAGLPLAKRSGLVGVHTPEKSSPETYERRIKVGFLTGRRSKIH